MAEATHGSVPLELKQPSGTDHRVRQDWLHATSLTCRMLVSLTCGLAAHCADNHLLYSRRFFLASRFQRNITCQNTSCRCPRHLARNGTRQRGEGRRFRFNPIPGGSRDFYQVRRRTFGTEASGSHHRQHCSIAVPSHVPRHELHHRPHVRGLQFSNLICD